MWEIKNSVEANVEDAHLGSFPVVIPRVGVEGTEFHPASAQLVLRVSEEAADICSRLKIKKKNKKNKNPMAILYIFVNKDK